MLTELGESFLIKIVCAPPSQPHFSLPILDIVLQCCAHPDYDLPDVTFNLWYRLSEELYTRNDDSLVAVFKSHVERLIVSILFCAHGQAAFCKSHVRKSWSEIIRFCLANI